MVDAENVTTRNVLRYPVYSVFNGLNTDGTYMFSTTTTTNRPVGHLSEQRIELDRGVLREIWDDWWASDRQANREAMWSKIEGLFARPKTVIEHSLFLTGTMGVMMFFAKRYYYMPCTSGYESGCSLYARALETRTTGFNFIHSWDTTKNFWNSFGWNEVSDPGHLRHVFPQWIATMMGYLYAFYIVTSTVASMTAVSHFNVHEKPGWKDLVVRSVEATGSVVLNTFGSHQIVNRMAEITSNYIAPGQTYGHLVAASIITGMITLSIAYRQSKLMKAREQFAYERFMEAFHAIPRRPKRLQQWNFIRPDMSTGFNWRIQNPTPYIEVIPWLGPAVANIGRLVKNTVVGMWRTLRSYEGLVKLEPNLFDVDARVHELTRKNTADDKEEPDGIAVEIAYTSDYEPYFNYGTYGNQIRVYPDENLMKSLRFFIKLGDMPYRSFPLSKATDVFTHHVALALAINHPNTAHSIEFTYPSNKKPVARIDKGQLLPITSRYMHKQPGAQPEIVEETENETQTPGIHIWQGFELSTKDRISPILFRRDVYYTPMRWFKLYYENYRSDSSAQLRAQLTLFFETIMHDLLDPGAVEERRFHFDKMATGAPLYKALLKIGPMENFPFDLLNIKLVHEYSDFEGSLPSYDFKQHLRKIVEDRPMTWNTPTYIIVQAMNVQEGSGRTPVTRGDINTDLIAKNKIQQLNSTLLINFLRHLAYIEQLVVLYLEKSEVIGEKGGENIIYFLPVRAPTVSDITWSGRIHVRDQAHGISMNLRHNLTEYDVNIEPEFLLKSVQLSEPAPTVVQPAPPPNVVAPLVASRKPPPINDLDMSVDDESIMRRSSRPVQKKVGTTKHATRHEEASSSAGVKRARPQEDGEPRRPKKQLLEKAGLVLPRAPRFSDSEDSGDSDDD